MGATDYFRLIAVGFSMLPYLFRILGRRITAVYHKKAYVPSDDPRTVVVVGGSFAGTALTKSLCETLPSGWRVVLVERNSHFNYVFVFPRYSAVLGHEEKAFIPYDSTAIAKSPQAPEGILEHVRESVTAVTDKEVILASGQKLSYDCLVVATGAKQPFPARLKSTDKDGACEELRTMQKRIREATRIAVVGGGPVGIEIASDIKTYFPDKEVTLVHSRDQLLPHFGRRLHDYVLPALQGLGMKVVLSQRPKVHGSQDDKPNSLEYSDGRIEEYDLVIPCTGQSPNSDLLRGVAAGSISQETNRIQVLPTLQIADPAHPNIFACGDVAESGGPQMARAAHIQAEVLCDNINLVARGKKATVAYKPRLIIEGALKLTLGKDKSVIYAMDEEGKDILITGHGVPEDFDIARGWGVVGAKYREELVRQ